MSLVANPSHQSADAAAGVLTSLADLKRKHDSEFQQEPAAKKIMTQFPPMTTTAAAPSQSTGPSQTPCIPQTVVGPSQTIAPPQTTVTAPATAKASTTKPQKTHVQNESKSKIEQPADPKADAAAVKAQAAKARQVRLEQNRKAARESRRRKKVMIEELQRSVIFFSRANGSLKQQNDELVRLLMQAQNCVANLTDDEREGKTATKAESGEASAKNAPKDKREKQQQKALEGKATAFAAPTATPVGVHTTSSTHLPPMQPGATMQAMANFQSAAAAAMRAAMEGMQSNPGVNMQSLVSTPVGNNAQQAYTDTMTALAMQQAAAAAASGHQFMIPGMTFLPNPMLAWQQAQQQQSHAHQYQQQQAAAGAAAALPKQPAVNTETTKSESGEV